MEDKTYDIIIIGSGIRGLSAAVILVHEGYSVVLLKEQH